MNQLNDWAKDRPFLLAIVVMLVVVIPGFVRTEQAIDKATEAAVLAVEASRENQRNAVVNCQNDNDMREGNKILWLFVLAISNRQNEPPPSKEQQLIVEKFRAWITELYEPHDCSDLDKKYTIPQPPEIPGLSR